MLVVVILGIVSQMVAVQYQNWVPEAKLNAGASELSAVLVGGRSEAALRSERLAIELDLDRQRYQFIWPPERRVSLDEPEAEEQAEGWSDLEEGVVMSGLHTVGGETVRKGRVRILVDRNGFTADSDIFLTLLDDESLVWTLQLRGLENRIEIVKDYEGRESFQQAVEEFAFR